MNLKNSARRCGFVAAAVLSSAALVCVQVAQASTVRDEKSRSVSRVGSQGSERLASRVLSLVPYMATGRCLESPGSDTANGTPVDILDCNGGNNQKWKFDPGWPSSAVLQVGISKCLDVNGGVLAPGARVVIADCNNLESQIWAMQTDGTIHAAVSGLCLGLMNSSGSGSGVRIWTCDGSNWQKWEAK